MTVLHGNNMQNVSTSVNSNHHPGIREALSEALTSLCKALWMYHWKESMTYLTLMNTMAQVVHTSYKPIWSFLLNVLQHSANCVVYV